MIQAQKGNSYNNTEIKAKCTDLSAIRMILKSKNAQYIGKDFQTDTYFNVKKGRLKLREGTIENFLIFYDRKNIKGPKKSSVILFKTESDASLKMMLSKALGILVVIKKHREIYFIDNTKFHLDSVKKLGSFVEIEAIGSGQKPNKKRLLKECQHYLELFNISEEDLIAESYSDMLIGKQ